MKTENQERDKFIANHLPVGMFPEAGGRLVVSPALSKAEARKIAERCRSGIASPTMASIVSAHLGVAVGAKKSYLPKLRPGDQHLLVSYKGPRIEDGHPELPEDGKITYHLVDFEVNL